MLFIKKINVGQLLLISVFYAGILIWLQSYYTVLKNWKAIAIAMILLALLFALFTKGQERKIVLVVPTGLIIATTIKIIIDAFSDPTSHNLWPFEIILLAITGLASASIGAGIGYMVKRFFKSSRIEG